MEMESKDLELGNEPVEVERRPRSGVVVSVRLSPGEADQLGAIAERRRMTLSQVAREAISSYLAGGMIRNPAAAPWTGTTSGNSNLELVYGSYGAIVRTEGSVKEADTKGYTPAR